MWRTFSFEKKDNYESRWCLPVLWLRSIDIPHQWKDYQKCKKQVVTNIMPGQWPSCPLGDSHSPICVICAALAPAWQLSVSLRCTGSSCSELKVAGEAPPPPRRRSSRLYTYTPTYTHLYTYTPTSAHLYTYNVLPKPPPPRRTHLDTHMCPQIQQPPPHYLESPWHLDQVELIWTSMHSTGRTDTLLGGLMFVFSLKQSKMVQECFVNIKV